MLQAPVEAFCKIEWRLKLIAFYISPGRNLNNKLKKILFGKFFFPAIEKLYVTEEVFSSHILQNFNNGEDQALCGLIKKTLRTVELRSGVITENHLYPQSFNHSAATFEAELPVPQMKILWTQS